MSQALNGAIAGLVVGGVVVVAVALLLAYFRPPRSPQPNNADISIGSEGPTNQGTLESTASGGANPYLFTDASGNIYLRNGGKTTLLPKTFRQ